MRLNSECSRCCSDQGPASSTTRFVAVTMQLAMVSAAQWDRELVADFAAERVRLRKAQMVSVAWLTSTDQAGLLGDKAHMLAIANTPRLGMHQDGFVDRLRRRRRLSFPVASICGASSFCIIIIFQLRHAF